jgi:hypothetical protein
MSDLSIPIERALVALGEQLAAEGVEVRLVVVGGAALNLLGVVERTTRDVDVIAIATPIPGGMRLVPPVPMPPILARGIATVARDLQLAPNWMNVAVAGQWQTGLPSGMDGRLSWRQFASLWVGLAGRRDLIAFKVYAAADQTGPDSRHMQDLLALAPTDAELRHAAEWIATQDPTIDHIVTRVIDHVRAHLR